MWRLLRLQHDSITTYLYTRNSQKHRENKLKRLLARISDPQILRRRPFFGVGSHPPTQEAIRSSHGRIRRLIILECDGDGLSLYSMFRASWVADENGLRQLTDNNPFTDCPKSATGKWHEIPEDYSITNPTLKYNSDGKWVRIGMRFGPDWYVVKQGQLNHDGAPESSSLADM